MKIGVGKNESWRRHNLERTREWCLAVGRAALNNDLINPRLVLFKNLFGILSAKFFGFSPEEPNARRSALESA